MGQKQKWVETVLLVDGLVVACEDEASCRAGLSLLDPPTDERMIDLSLVDVFAPKHLPNPPFCVAFCIINTRVVGSCTR